MIQHSEKSAHDLWRVIRTIVGKNLTCIRVYSIGKQFDDLLSLVNFHNLYQSKPLEGGIA